VLLADSHHVRLKLLHLFHGGVALGRKGPEQGLDEDRQQNDGHAPVVHVLLEKFKQPQQALGDHMEHTEVNTLGKLVRNRGELGAFLGPNPVRNRKLALLTGAEHHFRFFNGGAKHVLLHAALDGHVARVAGQHRSKKVGAHGASPVNLASNLRASGFKRLGRRFFAKASIVVPGKTHGIVTAASGIAGIGGHSVADANAAGLIRGVHHADFFADKIGIGAEGHFADNAQAVHFAVKAQHALLSGTNVQTIFIAFHGPLTSAPRRLAVHHKAQRGNCGGRGVNEVDQRRIYRKTSLILLELEGAQRAAASVKNGFIEGGVDREVAARGGREYGHGLLRGCDGLLCLLLLRLLLLGNNGRIRLADPAHVLGHVTPAHNNDEAQKDGDDQIFSVLHEGVHSWDSGGTSRGRLGGGTGS